MQNEPHKQWELLLQVAIAEGDVETIQVALGALRAFDPECAQVSEQDERQAA